MRHFVLLGILCCFLKPCIAQAGVPQNIRLKGLALVHIRSKVAGDLLFQQAVFVAEDRAQFVGLDDFGGIPFIVTFQNGQLNIAMPDGEVNAKGGKLKKLLSLPLQQNEFLSIIRHDRPENMESVKDGNGQEIWRDKKRKKLSITFSDFTLGPVEKYHYPLHIIVSHKKSLFDLKWQNLEFQEPSPL